MNPSVQTAHDTDEDDDVIAPIVCPNCGSADLQWTELVSQVREIVGIRRGRVLIRDHGETHYEAPATARPARLVATLALAASCLPAPTTTRRSGLSALPGPPSFATPAASRHACLLEGCPLSADAVSPPPPEPSARPPHEPPPSSGDPTPQRPATRAGPTPRRGAPASRRLAFRPSAPTPRLPSRAPPVAPRATAPPAS
jgi:hypothetical protein